ncbi:hypothetical protein ANCDUO_19501, partial [Ancylostoma duodenale]
NDSVETISTRNTKAKVSLEVREVVNASDEDVNDPNSKDFIRFMSAKQGNDATTIYVHDHSLRKTKVNETSIEECARVLSENLQDTFKRVTKSDQILQLYDQFVEPEQFDPRDELKRSKNAIENYLRRRAEFAY